jgi:hypothetical protein
MTMEHLELAIGTVSTETYSLNGTIVKDFVG